MKNAILCFILAAGCFLAAIVLFFLHSHSSGIVFACLAASLLCFGAVYLNKGN